MTTVLHKNLLQKIKRGAQQLRQPGNRRHKVRDKSKNNIILAYGKCGRITKKKPHMFAINNN